MTPREELAALGSFYATPVDAVLSTHGPALDRYAEWVLGRDAFSLVTLGDVDTLCALGSTTAAARLRSAAARWPTAIAGIKLDPAGLDDPTLYLRALCPWQDGIDWLACEVGAVANQIPTTRTLYGFGFQGEFVKTYALAPDGFISYRIAGNSLCLEHKDYSADIAWDAIEWPDARWSAIGALGRSLGFRNAGHVGRASETHALKIYVECTGAIPTDRSFA